MKFSLLIILGVMIGLLIISKFLSKTDYLKSYFLSHYQPINNETLKPQLLSTSCKPLEFVQEKGLFNDLSPEHSNKLFAQLDSHNVNSKRGQVAKVTKCELEDGNYLIINEKFIFGNENTPAKVHLHLLDKEFNEKFGSGLVVGEDITACNEIIAFTRTYQVFIRCKGSNRQEVHQANLLDYSSLDLSESGESSDISFTKKDLNHTQTGPHDFNCYPEEMTKIPDRRLVGFSCDVGAIDLNQRITIESNAPSLSLRTSIGNFCKLENNNILSVHKYLDKDYKFISQTVDLLDLNNKVESSITLNNPTSCNYPLIITNQKSESFFNPGDFIVYLGCNSGGRGIDVYKLNFSKGMSEKVFLRHQNSSCGY